MTVTRDGNKLHLRCATGSHGRWFAISNDSTKPSTCSCHSGEGPLQVADLGAVRLYQCSYCGAKYTVFFEGVRAEAEIHGINADDVGKAGKEAISALWDSLYDHQNVGFGVTDDDVDSFVAAVRKLREDATNDSEDDQLKATPPEFLTKLQWLIANRKKHWKLYALAAFIAATLTLVPFFLSDIADATKGLFATPVDAKASQIPAITVKLSNGDKKAIAVAGRGDFYIWLPGPGARQTIGKYRLLTAKGSSAETDIVRVESESTVTVYAQVVNAKSYVDIFKQEECDISIYIHREGGGVFTETIPFTKAAIEKNFVKAEVGLE